MITAQDQQSRELLPCPFCGGNAAFDEHDDECYFRKHEAQRRAVGDADLTSAFEMLAAWNRRAPAVQAARALPAGELAQMPEPAGTVVLLNGRPDCKQIQWSPGKRPAVGSALYTAAQVQAMGRVPPAWQAAPVEPTEEMLVHGGTECGTGMLGSPDEAGRVYKQMLAAAPQPPAAQEPGEVVITKNEAGAIVAVTRQDEEGRILSVLAESAAQERGPLDLVAAIKLGMVADDATRKHCRGTTNWAHALTRFYEKALERMPAWEPKFDVMAPGQEDLAIQFCNEISGPLGKPGRAPDPVRLLEMAEELYKAERDAAHCKEGGAA